MFCTPQELSQYSRQQACRTNDGRRGFGAGSAAMPRPSLVLVHGSFGTAAGWAPLQAAMESLGCKVHAVDLPWDKSPRTGGVPNLQDFVDTLVNFVSSKQLTNVALVGHLFGGVPISLALEGNVSGMHFDLLDFENCLVRVTLAQVHVTFKMRGGHVQHHGLSSTCCDMKSLLHLWRGP